MMPTTTANSQKVYVAVKADFTADGALLPRIITWKDCEKYNIDRIEDIRQASAMKTEG